MRSAQLVTILAAGLAPGGAGALIAALALQPMGLALGLALLLLVLSALSTVAIVRTLNRAEGRVAQAQVELGGGAVKAASAARGEYQPLTDLTGNNADH